MSNFLIRHAIKNVWCTPDQDYQYIFKPARISRPRGVERELAVEWEYLRLPNNVDTFHIYQIGQLSPLLLNLIPEEQTWYTLKSACNQQNLMVDLYLNNGRQFPRFDSYILKTRTRNLLIAVKNQHRIGSLETNPLYVRFYSNAYFASERSSKTVDKILVEGKYVDSPETLLLFQRRIRDLQKKPGHVKVYHNGWLVNDTPPDKVVNGDVIELVYDSTIYDVVSFPVKDLETFNSELDGVRKYLLSRLKGSAQRIDYVDDLDLYLVKQGPMHYQGVYFHKNLGSSIRNVTHKDYSIPVNHVVGFSNEFPDWKDPLDLTVQLHVRKSGYDRPLVDEHHRIKELYRLQDDEIYRAMIGADSTVPVWKAGALESSGYTKIMRSGYQDISTQLVQDAYGYNAVSKLLADTPQVVEDLGGYKGVVLPPGLREKSTVYEYDSSGKLIDFYVHEQGKEYVVNNPQCVLVEGIVGVGSHHLSTVYGNRATPIDSHHSYRMYTCPVYGDEPSYEWSDVTGNHDLYEIVDGEVVWMVDNSVYPAVKNDERFLSYHIDLAPVGGLLKFSVTAQENRGGDLVTLPLKIPVGHLAIWMNGHSLIENLDYYVDWPQIIIVNKKFVVEGESQAIVVRGTGFCLSDMSREPPAEFGFVKHGLLSLNNRFDVRDDKVMRFLVGGKTKHRQDIEFSEDDSGIRVTNIPNGTPYVAEDVVVPLRGRTVDDTYDLRQRSLEVDKSIGDYLSLKYPEPVYDEPNIIENRYPVFSPFVSKIHRDLQEGFLSPEGYDGQYSDAKLKEWLRDYEYLLDYDPIKKKVDERYVVVHPTELWNESELNIYQYTLLHRAIKVYLDDKVDLSRFVAIKEGWI